MKSIHRISAFAVRSALIALVLVASSCGDDSTGPDGGSSGDSIFGTYDLVTIDGSDLPWEDPQGLVMIVGGFMRLNADSTCAFGIEIDMLANLGFLGTYTIDGSSIDFIFDDLIPLTGTLIGNTLTVGDGGITYVFRK